MEMADVITASTLTLNRRQYCDSNGSQEEARMACDKHSLAPSQAKDSIEPQWRNAKEKNAPCNMQTGKKRFSREEGGDPNAVPNRGEQIKRRELRAGR